MERESMLIYKSFIDVSENLSDEDYRSFWDAIHKYGVYGQDIPEFANNTLNALMVLIEPLLRANIRNYENGCKGGAPKKNTNAKKDIQTTQKQPGVKPGVKPGVESGLNKKTTQKQGNDNVTVNVTDTLTVTATDNATVNDTVNDTENVTNINNINKKKNKESCPYVDENGIITDWDNFQEWKSQHPFWERDDE